MNLLKPRSRRIPVRIQIDHSTLEIFLDSKIMNISKGGVFIRTDLGPPPGSEVDFEFALPMSKRTICAQGIVVWARKKTLKSSSSFPSHPSGIGVQFKELNSRDASAILYEIDALTKKCQ